MGLDLGFYSVKTKIKSLTTYINETRYQKSLECKTEEEFYQFEELIDIDNSLEDWMILHMIEKSMGEDKIKMYDEAILITKVDLEDCIIPFLEQEDLNTKILGEEGKKKRICYMNNKEVTVDERYTKEFWNKVLIEFQKMLHMVDFENHSLVLMYSY